MKSLFALLIAMLSIQSGASVAKQLFPILGASGTTMLRISFAALILSLIWRPWARDWRLAFTGPVVAYGCSLGLMNLFFYLALDRIPLGIAVALEFVGPLVVTLWASKKALDFVWALLAVCGLILILPLQSISEPLSPLGVALALLAGGFWGLYIVFGQRISRSMPGGLAATYGMIFAAAVTWPFGILNSTGAWSEPKVLGLGLAVAVLSSALPYSLEMIALKELPTKTFGVLMSLEPAVAALSGFFFLHEKLTGLQWLAILCVIAASLGSTLTHRRPSPAVPPAS